MPLGKKGKDVDQMMVERMKEEIPQMSLALLKHIFFALTFSQ
jgi:hypothetical protein